jgi:hypothetical protein
LGEQIPQKLALIQLFAGLKQRHGIVVSEKKKGGKLAKVAARKKDT